MTAPPVYTIPPDLERPDPSALESIQAERLWHLPKETWEPIWEKCDGRNIKIAILDTGGGEKGRSGGPIGPLGRAWGDIDISGPRHLLCKSLHTRMPAVIMPPVSKRFLVDPLAGDRQHDGFSEGPSPMALTICV